VPSEVRAAASFGSGGVEEVGVGVVGFGVEASVISGFLNGGLATSEDEIVGAVDDEIGVDGQADVAFAFRVGFQKGIASERVGEYVTR